jgi:hypothetical protein
MNSNKQVIIMEHIISKVVVSENCTFYVKKKMVFNSDSEPILLAKY